MKNKILTDKEYLETVKNEALYAQYLEEHIQYVLSDYNDTEYNIQLNPSIKSFEGYTDKKDIIVKLSYLPRFNVYVRIGDYKMSFNADNLNEAIKALYGKDGVPLI